MNMKNNKRVMIIFVILFLVISIGTVSMIEFYYAKDSGKMPLISIKSENVSKQYYKYSSILFNAYKCYSGKYYAMSKRKEPTCNRIITYKDGYYTNYNGLKISKKDYQTIYDVSNMFDEIENFKTNKEVENALIVANEYEKNLSKIIRTEKIRREIVNIRVFKDLFESEYGDYSWVYMTDDASYYKCENNNLYKDYVNGDCIGEWKELTYSDTWCALAKDSYNLDIRDTYNKYCK